jgi:hypothetical protein
MVARGWVAALLVALLVVLLVTGTATAQTGCERAHECAENTAWVMPDGQARTSLYAWDPLYGYAHDVGAYGLAAFCYNYGGYYYTGADGTWYWFDC